MISDHSKVFSIKLKKLVKIKTNTSGQFVRLNTVKSNKYNVAKLVCDYFVKNDNLNENNYIRHKDGNINVYSNLEWSTFTNDYDNSDEVWKDLFGFEKDYKISKLGDIMKKNTSKLMKKQLNGHSYYTISLTNSNTNKRNNYQMHTLVAQNFINNLYPNTQTLVDHTDNNKQNKQNKLNIKFKMGNS